MSRRSRKKRRAKEQAEQQELLAEDVFVQQGSTWATLLEKNFVLVIAAIITVLVSIIVFESVRASKHKTSSAQTAQLMEGVEAYEQAIRFAVVTSTNAAEHKEHYESARETLALEKKTDLADQQPLSLLYDAELARRTGLLEEAIKKFDEYLVAVPEDDPLRFFALEHKGYALEASDQSDEALATFRTLSQIQEFDDFGHNHVARILLQRGKSEEARQALTSIVDRSEPSPFRAFAEKQLGEMD